MFSTTRADAPRNGCDDSPSKHASAHHASGGHQLISSFEPGEDWWWCYDDQLGFTVRDLPDFSHP